MTHSIGFFNSNHTRAGYKASASPCPITVPTCWPVSVWWDSLSHFLSKFLSKSTHMYFITTLPLLSSARTPYFSFPNSDVNKANSINEAHLVDQLLKTIEKINVCVDINSLLNSTESPPYCRGWHPPGTWHRHWDWRGHLETAWPSCPGISCQSSPHPQSGDNLSIFEMLSSSSLSRSPKPGPRETAR